MLEKIGPGFLGVHKLLLHLAKIAGVVNIYENLFFPLAIVVNTYDICPNKTRRETGDSPKNVLRISI